MTHRHVSLIAIKIVSLVEFDHLSSLTCYVINGDVLSHRHMDSLQPGDGALNHM